MFRLALTSLFAIAGSASAAGTLYEVSYPAPEAPKPGEAPKFFPENK